MPHLAVSRRAVLLVVAVLAALPAAAARGQVQPANASFASGSDQQIFTHDFGTFRQGAAGTSINFSVFNRFAPIGTTSAMTLVDIQEFGFDTQLPISGSISNLAAGGQAQMQLGVLTNQYGSLSVNYILDFQSDQLPASHDFLAITAYAKILPVGDYDSDGDVDNADRSVWRANFGTHNAAADGNLNGTVDGADYVLWRNNFTGPLGAGSGSLSLGEISVPEPATTGVFATLVLACVSTCRRRAK
jgi:hypothetical protein